MIAVPVTEACIIQSAEKYQVPLYAVSLILAQEHGQVGKVTVNTSTNQSRDVGPMQINWETWDEELAKISISAYQLQWDGCLNVEVGTWLLAKAIVESRAKYRNEWTIWHGIARYHSKTPEHQRKYLANIKEKITALRKEPAPIKKLAQYANGYLSKFVKIKE